MTLRWSVPDRAFKLENEFHREAMLLIASLIPSNMTPEQQKRYEHLMELSDLLTKEWENAYPVVDGKEFKHFSIGDILSKPIRN